MLWLRGLVFTLLMPGSLAILIPAFVDRDRQAAGGWYSTGWAIVACGAAVYLATLLSFLSAGGTPAIFFTRRLRTLIGEEPGRLVDRGLFRYSRNPMYAGVLLVVAGQAIAFASPAIAIYCAVVALVFHLTVVWIEEPHLRRERGAAYQEYCLRVPRWLGRRR